MCIGRGRPAPTGVHAHACHRRRLAAAHPRAQLRSKLCCILNRPEWGPIMHVSHIPAPGLPLSVGQAAVGSRPLRAPGVPPSATCRMLCLAT